MLWFCYAFMALLYLLSVCLMIDICFYVMAVLITCSDMVLMNLSAGAF